MYCPCGNDKKYTDCCEIGHQNISDVVTAEQLMRSRYTAFVLANGDYLMSSHHSSTRPTKEKKELVTWAKSVNWIRLEILETTLGTRKDNVGTVTFNAFFYKDGKVEVLHEKSAFERENGSWMYVGLSEE